MFYSAGFDGEEVSDTGVQLSLVLATVVAYHDPELLTVRLRHLVEEGEGKNGVDVYGLFRFFHSLSFSLPPSLPSPPSLPPSPTCVGQSTNPVNNLLPVISNKEVLIMSRVNNITPYKTISF